MSVVASDLVLYHAATQSDTDVGAVGGAIDTLRRPDFTQIAANDDIEVVSSSGSDTQNCTIVARKADGSIVSETLALTGVAAKIFAGNGVIERVLSVELASNAVGTVTVQRSVAGAVLRTIPAGERGFSAFIRKGTSLTTGAVDYYSKLFWKNTNGANALLSAQVTESADPSGLFTFALANAVGDAGTAADRKTVPGAVTAFDNAAKNVPGTDLAAGAAIGTWLKMSLAQNNAAVKTTYTPQLAGSTT